MVNLVGDGLLYPDASPPQESHGPSNPWNNMDSHASLVEEFDLYGALMAKLGDKRKLRIEDETRGASSLTNSLASLSVNTSISATTDGILERSLHDGYGLSTGGNRDVSSDNEIMSVARVISPPRPNSLEASYCVQPLEGAMTSIEAARTLEDGLCCVEDYIYIADTGFKRQRTQKEGCFPGDKT